MDGRCNRSRNCIVHRFWSRVFMYLNVSIAWRGNWLRSRSRDRRHRVDKNKQISLDNDALWPQKHWLYLSFRFKRLYYIYTWVQDVQIYSVPENGGFCGLVAESGGSLENFENILRLNRCERNKTDSINSRQVKAYYVMKIPFQLQRSATRQNKYPVYIHIIIHLQHNCNCLPN
jgi:hypothetical protein